jgi:uncharacterized protein YbaP (TraB family)
MAKPWPRSAAVVLAALFGLALPARAAPAWWKVTDGHAEVWVLGAPPVTPKTQFWDIAAVERRLAGASRLIVAVQPRNGIAAMASVLGSGASPTPMEASLPPALRARFDAVARGIGQDPRRYDHWKPGIAGAMLAGDVYKSADLKQGEVEAVVRKLARKAGVRETAASTPDAALMAKAITALSPAGQQTCLSSTLRGLEVGTARMKADADAWARGAWRAPPPDAAQLACLAAMPGLQAQTERGIADQASALADALKQPGHAVAVLNQQQLTMPNGVFDRLKARGLTVAGPLP